MEDDDETTVSQLHTHLASRGCSLSLSTIQRSCTKMGWTFRGSAYCQLTRDVSKEKRLIWAQENLTAALEDGFTDVLWTDENCKATDDIVFVKQVANLDQNQGVFVNFHIILYNFVYCLLLHIMIFSIHS